MTSWTNSDQQGQFYRVVETDEGAKLVSDKMLTPTEAAELLEQEGNDMVEIDDDTADDYVWLLNWDEDTLPFGVIVFPDTNLDEDTLGEMADFCGVEKLVIS